jgi:uncharacterized protein YxjI
LTIRDRRRLLDADGNQIATLHKALISMHDRSYINLGDSTDQDEAIASVQKVLLSFGHDLQVYLKEGDGSTWDFKVSGDFLAHSFKVYSRDDQVAAEIGREIFNSRHIFTGAETYQVKIQPNVDSAFIVALVALIDLVFRQD